MNNNYKIFQVGGSVRDELLGLKSKDIDYAVECDGFDHMREIILSLGGKIFLETPKFFTIRAQVPVLGATDYVLCRKDGAYSDGRRPDSVEHGTILDDLARRDFTVNAIAKNVATGEIIDPYNGRADLEIKLLRAVRDPQERLREDRLRALRALRFAITKDFTIGRKLETAIRELTVEDYAGVSTERIREEVLKMFQKNSRKSFEILFTTYFEIFELIESRDIWFKPTTEAR